VLCAIGAEVSLVSAAGERRIPVAELFHDDGIQFLAKRPDEILSAIHLPPADAHTRSSYKKLRRRGSFDFPVLGVAAMTRVGAGGVVERARIVLTGVGSRPHESRAAAEKLIGRRIDDEAARREAAAVAAQLAKPLDNTDFSLGWRKEMARRWVSDALAELARPAA
jgi:4-hydroxybenzoyl-CoA reductase subunit beta